MIVAPRIYIANGIVRWACERAYWPLFMTLLVTEVGLTPFQLVLLGTCYEAAIFASEIPTGIVADLYSRRLSVIASYLIGGSAFVFSAAVSSYWLLVASQLLVGFGFTFHSGAETAWITDEVGGPEAAEPLILRRSQIQFLAAIGGIAAFGGLAVVTSLRVAVGATGVGLVAWGLSLFRTMGESGFAAGDATGWRDFAAMLRTGATQVARHNALRILGVIVVIGGIAKEAIDRLDIRRLDDIGFPSEINEATIVAVLVATRLLVAAGLLGVVRRRVRGQAVVAALAALLAMVAAGIALLAHADLLWLAAVGLVAQGGFHSATQPLVVLWTNTFADARARATVHSFMGQAESIGEVVGGLTLGAVAQLVSVSAAMTCSAALFVAAAGVATTARRHWTQPN